MNTETIEGANDAIVLVRELADTSVIHYSSDGEMHWCLICDEPLVLYPSHHKPSCLWRRAVEWVDLHPNDKP